MIVQLTARIAAAINACDGIDDATLAAMPQGALCEAYAVCADLHDALDKDGTVCLSYPPVEET